METSDMLPRFRNPIEVNPLFDNSYPNYNDSNDYYTLTYLEREDFDKEKDIDLKKGEGFIISSPKNSLKAELKNPEGIHSYRFGSRLSDPNPYQERYSCNCGELKGHINKRRFCQKCQSYCRRVDDDFGLFGWVTIDEPYAIINPDIYKVLDCFFGKSKFAKDKKTKKGSVLQNIVYWDKEISQDGYVINTKEKPNEPFYGIGMIEFRERFDEIMEYYRSIHKNNANKMAYYNDIMRDRNLVFIHSIPVYTTHLRPMDIDLVEGRLAYEDTNKYYTMIQKLAAQVNKHKRRMDRVERLKNDQLYRLQAQLMALYDEVLAICSGKKGELRNLFSGRYNMSSRNVIKQNPDLRIDQVELPYTALVICNEQLIINVLMRTYNISPQEAWDRWYRAVSDVDPIIVQILEDMIHNRCDGEGIPVMINRNPSIAYGSLLQMYCKGINYNYTMSMPLQVLPLLAADFDKQTLSHIWDDKPCVKSLFNCLETCNARLATA